MRLSYATVNIHKNQLPKENNDHGNTLAVFQKKKTRKGSKKIQIKMHNTDLHYMLNVRELTGRIKENNNKNNNKTKKGNMKKETCSGWRERDGNWES